MGHRRARFVFLSYRDGAAVLRFLPRPLGRALTGGAGLAAWATGPKRRAIVATNLRRVLGPEASPSTVRRTVRRAYLSYARYWFEAAHLDASDPSVLDWRLTVGHPERLQEAAARGRGLIIVLPHVGCWEAGAIWTASLGYPLMTVAEVLEPPELFEWFVTTRKRAALTVLPVGGATTTQLLNQLRNGNAIALLADRDVVGDGLPTPFFGRPTPIPAGPAVLALRSGAAVLPVAIYLEPRGHFHVEILPELDTTRSGGLRADVVRLTNDMIRALEVLISARPEQWHVFQSNWPDGNREPDR